MSAQPIDLTERAVVVFSGDQPVAAQPAEAPIPAEWLEPKKKTEKVVARLDHIAAKVALYDRAVEEANELLARIKQLRAEIEQDMADSNSGTVGGVEVFTRNTKNSYRTRELQDAYPDLTQHYIRPVTKEAFDMAAFAKAHPTIAEKYRTVEFRRANGIQLLR